MRLMTDVEYSQIDPIKGRRLFAPRLLFKRFPAAQCSALSTEFVVFSIMKNIVRFEAPCPDFFYNVHDLF